MASAGACLHRLQLNRNKRSADQRNDTPISAQSGTFPKECKNPTLQLAVVRTPTREFKRAVSGKTSCGRTATSTVANCKSIVATNSAEPAQRIGGRARSSGSFSSCPSSHGRTQCQCQRPRLVSPFSWCRRTCAVGEPSGDNSCPWQCNSGIGNWSEMTQYAAACIARRSNRLNAELSVARIMWIMNASRTRV